MTTSKEAWLWETVGAAVLAGGGIVVVASITSHGGQVQEPATLSVGLMGAFLMLAGIASGVTGRVLRTLETGEAKHTAILQAAGVAAGVLGVVAVTIAGVRSQQHGFPTLNQVATGLAGSFAAMAGILLLAGARMKRQIVARSEKPAAKAAGAA